MSDAQPQQQTATAGDAALRFTGGLTISTNVKDLDGAIAWYADVLGLELLYKVDELRWAEMRTPIPGVNLGLGENERPDVKGNTPVWDVADLDDARARLEAKGVRFDGPTQEIPGMVKLATFFDPDSNPYMLSQNLTGA